MTHAEIFELNDKITHQQRLTRIRVNIILLMKSNTKGKYSTKEENVNIIEHATHQKIVATYQKQETRLERKVFFFFFYMVEIPNGYLTPRGRGEIMWGLHPLKPPW